MATPISVNFANAESTALAMTATGAEVDGLWAFLTGQFSQKIIEQVLLPYGVKEIQQKSKINFVFELNIPPKPFKLPSSHPYQLCSCLSILIANWLQHPWGKRFLNLCINEAGGILVDESIFILNNHNIIDFPSGINIKKSLQLSGCINLKTIPNDITIEWLNLFNCKSFSRLPNKLIVQKDIILKNTSWDQVKPKNLHVGGKLIWK